jgi:hypothetical protein
MLKPYWITTTEPMSLGYGVTARSVDDAETQLRRVLADDHAITKITLLNDIRSLDQNHVACNMGNMLRRGIWYPLGYENPMD